MNTRGPFPKEPEKADIATEGVSSAGVPPAIFPLHDSNIKIRSRGRLPHWEATGAVYFVTFRLADSLPQDVLQRIRFARQDISGTAARMGREVSDSERKRLTKLRARRIEKYLDAGAGACFLRNNSVAKMVVGALGQFDGKRYRLFAWCVMPNHVHVVFQALFDNSLENVLHSWKSYTAKKANLILQRSGEFWQHEYFDRLIRDAREFERAVSYVAENPSKARLNEWPWVWSCR